MGYTSETAPRGNRRVPQQRGQRGRGRSQHQRHQDENLTAARHLEPSTTRTVAHRPPLSPCSGDAGMLMIGRLPS